MIKSIVTRAWHSPTFTTWGNNAISSLRLLLVTPLILAQFDSVELSSWYLFASLNIFGTLVSQRVGLTFTRMFAFAMAGSANLAPIRNTKQSRADLESTPNWQAFKRAYGTAGLINGASACINVMVASALGWFALTRLTSEYESARNVWAAFVAMQLSSFILFFFSRYEFALRGMNYVALCNRWRTFFSLLSVLAGTTTLLLSGNIFHLAVAMQCVELLSVVRNWILLRHVEGGKVATFPSFRFDRQVLSWVWEPSWKGFLWNLTSTGSVPLTAVLYARMATPPETAAFAFAGSLLKTASQISQAPFNSAQPVFSRLLAQRDLESLRRLVFRKIVLSQVLLLAAVIAMAVLGPTLLSLLDSEMQTIPATVWLLFGGLTFLMRMLIFCNSVSAMGNDIRHFKASSLAFITSAALILIFRNSLGIYTPILTALVPAILFINIGPFRDAHALLAKSQ